jgi:hypothetical protein
MYVPQETEPTFIALVARQRTYLTACYLDTIKELNAPFFRSDDDRIRVGMPREYFN